MGHFLDNADGNLLDDRSAARNVGRRLLMIRPERQMTEEKAEPSFRIYLVDGSSYLYRSFYAVRGLQNRDGLPTNAIFGFVSMISRILKTKSPTHMAIAFDTPAPTFRHERYPEYKAHRDVIPEDLVRQIPYIKRIVRLLGIPIVERDGVEADDVIGTLSKEAVDNWRADVVLVSSDKDFFQLLSDRVHMWDTMKDVVVTPEEVKNRFGVEPPRVLEVMGLMGDSSDNIPGVPGIGEKTAVKLISDFGGMDELLDRWEDVKQNKIRNNLKEFRDQALLSKELMTIKTDVPLDLYPADLQLGQVDREELKKLYAELDFQSLIEEETSTPEARTRDYRTITRLEDLEALVEELSVSPVVAVDTETTSREPMRARLVGVSLCGEAGRAYYVPLGHSPLAAPEQVNFEAACGRLRGLLENESICKVGHNLKYDLLVFENHGLHCSGPISDTMVASYLIDPDRHAHGLDKVAWEFLGERVISYKEVAGSGKKEITFDAVPVERACEYASEDADMAFRLHELLIPELKSRALDRLMDEVETPLVFVLAAMERWGVKIDRDHLRGLSKELSEQARAIEDRIYKLAGRRFNLNSPKQLSAVLFDEMGLAPVKKTKKKSGYSTDMEVLSSLAQGEPIAEELVNYRTLTKLISTYVDTLPRLVHPDTGRVHTSFNQTVTSTGRLSSSNPNLQNIPVRGEFGRRVREAFIPEPGCTMVSADYSQIELRILAHYSGDPALVGAFRRGEDVHTQTACGMFGVGPDEVTSDMRRRAKVVNFGIIYGMQAFGLARELNISRGEAKEYIDNYFKRFAGVKSFFEKNLREAEKNGFVSTLLGRRRYLPQLTSKNNALRSNAERIATNTPIQGSAADVIKIAMIRLFDVLRNRFPRVRMILQVHDELVFEVPDEQLDQLTTVIREHMEGALTLEVPLSVDVNWGNNWAEAH
jgi:DNA polymerase-1